MQEQGTDSAADSSRLDVLGCVPLFSCFTPEELARLAELFVEVSYRKGDTICAEGEEGDTFFVLIAGELEVWGGAGQKRVIYRMKPGEFLGEMSLLLGGPRTATVTAFRSSRLLALNKLLFDRFFRGNPKVIEYFSKELCRRLASTSRGDLPDAVTTVVNVTATGELKGKSLVAGALAGLLDGVGRGESILVRAVRGNGDAASGSPLAELVATSNDGIGRHLARNGWGTPVLTVTLGSGDETSLGTLLGRLGTMFPFVVLDLGTPSRAVARAAEQLADIEVRIVDRFDASLSRAAARVLQVVNLFNKSSARVPICQCEPFVLPDDATLRGLDPEEQPRHLSASPRPPAHAPLSRLARKIVGGTVGVALGGGAAFGIAHVGVLRVLEDNDIPVDLIAGCSMGSVIAASYAAGLRAQALTDIVRRIGTKRNTLSAVLDFTLVRPGLLAGARLVSILSPLLGEIQSFEQFVLPCQMVATDIETGERVCLNCGRIDEAFRASCSVPMLWSPVSRDGRVLVDGGVCDPVPAEVVRDMGADVCIAVNVVPRLKRGVQTVLSRWYQTLNPLAYLQGVQAPPSMFDIIMNSMQVLEHELGHFKAITADVRINPDLTGFTWLEFYRGQELIDRGIEAAERAMPEIKRVLRERVAAARRPELSVSAGGTAVRAAARAD